MNNSSLTILAIALSCVSVILVIYALWQLTALNKLRKTFFLGKAGTDLENILFSLNDNLKRTQEEQLVLEDSLTGLKNDFAFAIQKIGVIRFNPFADGGGNFSFCIALLDGNSSGVTITSMYGREQNRIYSKKIENGKCDLQLTEEEQKAIYMANTKPIT